MTEPRARATLIQALAAELEIAAPDAVLAALTVFYDEVDQAVRAKSHGLELPCRAGCDACCRESVFLSAPEFLAVVAHLAEKWRPDELRVVIEEMSRLAAAFEDELEMLETMPAGPERDEVAARVKFDCPFLSEGRCRIYAVRELNARTFGASWDVNNDEAYGCELTNLRLRVLPASTGSSLVGAREMRARLAARFPSTESVHVYPWWFRRHHSLLKQLAEAPEA